MKNKQKEWHHATKHKCREQANCGQFLGPQEHEKISLNPFCDTVRTKYTDECKGKARYSIVHCTISRPSIPQPQVCNDCISFSEGPTFLVDPSD
jgi:hypothetical protein